MRAATVRIGSNRSVRVRAAAVGVRLVLVPGHVGPVDVQLEEDVARVGLAEEVLQPAHARTSGSAGPARPAGRVSSRNEYAASWLCVYSRRPRACGPGGRARSRCRRRRPSRPCTACWSGRCRCRCCFMPSVSAMSICCSNVAGLIRAWVPLATSPLSSRILRISAGVICRPRMSTCLVVAGELDLLVADLGEPGQYALEAVRHAAVVRRGGDPVADAVQDDAAVPRRDQWLRAETAVRDHRRTRRQHARPGRRQRRRRTGRRGQDVPSGQPATHRGILQKFVFGLAHRGSALPAA